MSETTIDRAVNDFGYEEAQYLKSLCVKCGINKKRVLGLVCGDCSATTRNNTKVGIPSYKADMLLDNHQSR